LATNTNRILNITLHGATLGARFVFIFFLAKYLEPAAVGYYGLFTAAVGYSIYFVGLDYYTYVTREILKTPKELQGLLLKSQASLSGLLYLIFTPIIVAVLLQYSGWPQYLFPWFLPILLLEHFNQEIYRLLIALSEQITASIILFIRQGSWALAAVALMTLDPSSRQLQIVMALWVAAGLAAAITALWKILKLRMGGWRSSLDWAWVRRGVVVSVAFLLATLSLRGIQTFDRYWLEALGGIEIVGAYVLFFGVASTLLTFLDAGIFAFTYPILIKLHQSQEYGIVHKKVNQMYLLTAVLSTGFAFVSWFLLPYLLLWIDNPVYVESIDLYAWLLSAMVINALSMVPHFALYAQGRDKPIIQSHIAALFVFVGATWALSESLSMMAVPIGLNLSFVVILAWKAIAYKRLTVDNTESSAQHSI
jgi:O-antigen/teichoic acid export membrane protein